MKTTSDSVAVFVLGCVIVAWLAFVPIFVFRKRAPRVTVQKRDPQSRVGILIQAIAFAMVWAARRRPLGMIAPLSLEFEYVVGAVTVLIAAGSACLVGAAVRTLGKQWTYVARTIEGHELITTGPYAFVRNPIYLGMFGMLVATGLALTRWPVLLVAIIVFICGTIIRIRSEEKLLRETFGSKFEDYTRHVPAFLPGIF